MHYKIRYPGSRPRTTSAAKPKSKHNWMFNGTKLAGFHVAGQCIVCLLIFGFGLSIIGGLSLVMSASAGLNDGQYKSPPAIVGCAFLASGVSFLLIGLMFFCCAARRAKRMLLREKSAGPSIQESYICPQVAGTLTEEAGEEPPLANDPSVYHISGAQDAISQENYGTQNGAYITDKSDERDPGFTGFTYTDMGDKAEATGEVEEQRHEELQARGLPTRLPPIQRDTEKTVYSTPATFGMKE